VVPSGENRERSVFAVPDEIAGIEDRGAVGIDCDVFRLFDAARPGCTAVASEHLGNARISITLDMSVSGCPRPVDHPPIGPLVGRFGFGRSFELMVMVQVVCSRRTESLNQKSPSEPSSRVPTRKGVKSPRPLMTRRSRFRITPPLSPRVVPCRPVRHFSVLHVVPCRSLSSSYTVFGCSLGCSSTLLGKKVRADTPGSDQFWLLACAHAADRF
jgi:hypothetical protein